MEGQITLTDYLRSQIELKQVMDLTEWINTQDKGKAQYGQIKDIIREYVSDEDVLDRLTNKISCFVLDMSLGYMGYLRDMARLK